MSDRPHGEPGVRFGDFELDVRSHTLWRQGTRVNLPEQPLAVLSALLERPGEVVTRDQLRRRLWTENTHVDFEHGLNAAVKRLRHALGDAADAPRYIETIPRRGYRFIGAHTVPAVHAAPPEAARIRSLAVLPLLNLSADPDQDYFADGLTEALIAQLAQIGGLRVISRTSAMRYRETRMSLAEIARELRIDGIVEGSVVRAGDRIRITAQLIDVATDTHLWAHSYERASRDVLTLQSDVARAIAEAVEIKVTRHGGPHPAPAGPIDPAAHEAYLKGRHYRNKATEEGFWKAVEHLRIAVGIEPAFAAAHAALADVHIALAALGAQIPSEAFREAEAESRIALGIDHTLADAHRALALVHMCDKWDWASAEAAFERALDANAGSAETHWQYGLYLIARGQGREAVAELEHARVLDPLSLMINNDLAFALWTAGRDGEALDQYRRTLELDANFLESRRELGLMYAHMGEVDAALVELTRALALARDPETLSFLGYAFGVAGRDDAGRILGELDLLSKVRYISPLTSALVQTGLGDHDAAFLSLERACDDRSPSVIFVKSWPVFDRLHSDHRFNALLRRMSLGGENV